MVADLYKMITNHFCADQNKVHNVMKMSYDTLYIGSDNVVTKQHF